MESLLDFNGETLKELAQLEALKQQESFGEAWKEAEKRQLIAMEFLVTAEQSMRKAYKASFDMYNNPNVVIPETPKYEEGAELITFDDNLNTKDMSNKRGNKNVKDVSFTRVSDYPIKEYGVNGLCKVPSVLVPKFQVINNFIKAIDRVNLNQQARADKANTKPSFVTMSIKAVLVDDRDAIIADGEESSARKAVGEIITMDLSYGKVGSIAEISISVSFVQRNFHERMEYFEQIVLSFGIESMMQLAAIQLIDKL